MRAGRRCAVLQVHVAHRQRHHGDAGLGDPLDRAPSASRSSCTESTQQWPASDLAGEAGLDHRIGEMRAARASSGRAVSSTWRSRSRPSSPASSTRCSMASALCGSDGDGAAEHAADALAVLARPPSSASGRAACRGRPAPPPATRSGRAQCVAHLGEHLPADRRAAAASESMMRADRRGAVRVGGAQRKIHAALRRRRPSSALAVVVARREQRTEKLPSGFCLRGQMWPLSRWVWMSTKAGSTRPRRGRGRGRAGVARCEAIFRRR